MRLRIRSTLVISMGGALLAFLLRSLRRWVVFDRLRSRPIYLLAWYSVVTWCAYKTVYFTPRNSQFADQFAVKDYQSIWS